MKHIVIVDIDGTISKVGERLKYIKQELKDWNAFYEDCFQDEPIQPIVNLVKDLIRTDYQVVFCTGRRESVRFKTLSWIKKHIGCTVSSSTLLMREDGDHREDDVVKPDLLAQAGITTYDVAFILEDRDKVVKKWRELGFTCLQVCNGSY